MDLLANVVHQFSADELNLFGLFLNDLKTRTTPGLEASKTFGQYVSALRKSPSHTPEKAGSVLYLLLQYILRFDSLSDEITLDVFDSISMLHGPLWRTEARIEESDGLLRAVIYILSPEQPGCYDVYTKKPPALQVAGMKAIASILRSLYKNYGRESIESLMPILIRVIVFLTDSVPVVSDHHVLTSTLLAIDEWFNTTAFDGHAAQTVLPGTVSKLVNLASGKYSHPNTETRAKCMALFGKILRLANAVGDIASLPESAMAKNIEQILRTLQAKINYEDSAIIRSCLLDVVSLFIDQADTMPEGILSISLDIALNCASESGGGEILRVFERSEAARKVLKTLFASSLIRLPETLSSASESNLLRTVKQVEEISKYIPALTFDTDTIFNLKSSVELSPLLDAKSLRFDKCGKWSTNQIIEQTARRRESRLGEVAVARVLHQVGFMCSDPGWLISIIYDDIKLLRKTSSSRQLASLWADFHLLQGVFDGGFCDQDSIFELLATLYDQLAQIPDETSNFNQMCCGILAMTELGICKLNADDLAMNHELPILLLQYVGKGSSNIQSSALAAFSSYTRKTGHDTEESWVVSNVDYIVDDILRNLTAQRMGVQTISLLTALISMGGTGVAPYLEDIALVMINVLRQYHGYETVVLQSLKLFESISQALCKTIEAPLRLEPSSTGPTFKSLDEIVKELKHSPDASHILQKHPEEPSDQEFADKSDAEEDSLLPPLASLPSDSDPVDKPVRKSSYGTIVSLCREEANYLTHPNAKVVSTVLNLITAQIPFLASDENAFLPLVNQIWPSICHALLHGKSPVPDLAVQAIEMVCFYANGFVNERFLTLWQDLTRQHHSPRRMLALLKRSIPSLTLSPSDVEDLLHDLALMAPESCTDALISIGKVLPDLEAFHKQQLTLT